MTPHHVSLPLGLPGERGRRKATENRKNLPHVRCVSTKTQGWSRLLALTTLILEYSHLAHFAITVHLQEPALVKLFGCHSFHILQGLSQTGTLPVSHRTRQGALLCPCVGLGSAGSLSSAENDPPLLVLGPCGQPRKATSLRGGC